VGAVSHDRFRYGLIIAAYIISALFFVRFYAITGLQPIWFPRTYTCFFFPTVALIVLLIFKSLASRDPFRTNYTRFRRTYELLLDIGVVLIIGIHLIVLALLLVWQGRIGSWLKSIPTTLVGVMLLIIGNILPRVRPNSAMGIRTPWTLRDENVWARTHRVGGYVLLVFGVALLAWTYIDFQKVWWVIVPGLIVTLIGLPLLSYIFWKRRPAPPSASPITSEKD
jgi:uncharacterized membrane protein